MDPRLAALRRHQRAHHGLFTLQHALDAGFTRPAVRRRVLSHEWQEVHTRVYRVADGRPLDERGRVLARILVVRGVASGLSAAALWGFVAHPREPEVTVLWSRRRQGAGARSSRELDPVDTTTVDRVPVTTAARTLIDIAPALPPLRFEAVLDTAIVTGTVRVDRLEARARALWVPARPGCALVLRLLDERHPDLAAARNTLEALALRACRRARLPSPAVNHRVVVGGRVRYLDLAWPDERIAVELDGFVPHSNRTTFDDDRVRQNDLVAAGWIVFRLTWTVLKRDGAAAFAPIVATLLTRAS